LSLVRRLLYYFGGFTVGLLILFYFLGGKRASCEYGPTARTLKNIRQKERIVSQEVLMVLQDNQQDTSVITTLLAEGTVLFSESNTSLDSCKIYMVQGKVNMQKLKIEIENCNSIATITKATFH
tara:strand:- start:49397 stop:49768 length:372 start_codon:yes stop_codon:yes gene_type:complete